MDYTAEFDYYVVNIKIIDFSYKNLLKIFCWKLGLIFYKNVTSQSVQDCSMQKCQVYQLSNLVLIIELNSFCIENIYI